MPLSPEEIAKIEEEEKIRAQAREKYSTPQTLNITSDVKQKNGVPLLLSLFIPGLGQIVKGEIFKGIIVFVCFVLGCFFFIIPGIIVWVIQLIDAYN